MTQPDIFEPDGRAVTYVDEGEGPALVLVPGRGTDISGLGTLAGVLAEEGFRVVRIGAGRAVDATSSTAAEDAARDVVDVMDAISLEDAWIGGHAFGGVIARAVSRDHTDRVNGVLLLGVEGTESPDGGLAPGVPVLVIQGGDDSITPATNGEQLQTGAPDRVSVVTLDGAGHLFPSTHAGETAAVIEDYLDWD